MSLLVVVHFLPLFVVDALFDHIYLALDLGHSCVYRVKDVLEPRKMALKHFVNVRGRVNWLDCYILRRWSLLS